MNETMEVVHAGSRAGSILEVGKMGNSIRQLADPPDG